MPPIPFKPLLLAFMLDRSLLFLVESVRGCMITHVSVKMPQATKCTIEGCD